MTNHSFAVIAVIAVAGLLAAGGQELFAADTLRVVTHDGVTIVTDPSTGAKSYPAWGRFPPDTFQVRRVTLRVSFGCPDSMRCADWDYLDRIVVRRKGAAPSDTLNHEIARMITPYGGAFARDWRFGWTADVTDFAGLLRDSVEIDYVHTGYEPNADRGWKVSVAFEFTGGRPAARPVAIEKIYDGSYAYGDSTRPIGASLAPVSFLADDEAAFARLLVFQTGHGSDDSGCGEFCRKFREIVIDGRSVDRRPLWRKCGDNPLSPQAGTWIYDRANWCPGDLIEPEAFDFPVKPGETHTVDIEMEPHSVPGSTAVEAVTAWVVQYAEYEADYDVGLVSIEVPSSDDEHRRSNPACSGARVVVKNFGAATIGTFSVRYGTVAFDDDRFVVWEGTLAPGAATAVDLPGDIRMRVGGNRFRAEVFLTGRTTDAWPDDNVMLVPFLPAPAHRSPVVLQLRTNAEPSQTSYTLRRGDGTGVRERKAGTLGADTTVTDTFRLDPGCYTLEIADSAGDGLEFWYNVKGGRGWARLLDLGGSMLRGFESDFGSFIRYNFRITEDRRIWAAPSAEPAIGLFPTRTLGKTTLDYFSNTPGAVSVKIVPDSGGAAVEEHEYPALRSGSFTYDLASRGPQRYYLQVYVDGALKFNKRVRVVEKLE